MDAIRVPSQQIGAVAIELWIPELQLCHGDVELGFQLGTIVTLLDDIPLDDVSRLAIKTHNIGVNSTS